MQRRVTKGPSHYPKKAPEHAYFDENSKYLDITPNLSVHYKRTLPTGTHRIKRTIVLLHGFMSHLNSFRKVQQQLSDFHSAQVVSYDRVGFGLTTRPVDDHHKKYYTNEGCLNLLEQVIEKLKHPGHNKVTLIGNSAGGTIAMAFAIKKPELVERIVLVDAAIFNDGPPDFVRSLVRSSSLMAKLCKKIYNMQPSPYKPAYFDYKKTADSVLVSDYHNLKLLPNFAQAMVILTEKGSSWNIPQAIKEGKLPKTPIGLIHGKDDAIIKSFYSQKVQKLLFSNGYKKVTYHIIFECGHLPQEEQPEEFLGLVGMFFNKFQDEETNPASAIPE